MPITVCGQCTNYRRQSINKDKTSRYCYIKNSDIDYNTQACRKFKRINSFYCDKYRYYIDHVVCYWRRYVRPDMLSYTPRAFTCKYCKQFNKEIKDIITDAEHEYVYEKSNIKIKRTPKIKRRGHKIKRTKGMHKVAKLVRRRVNVKIKRTAKIRRRQS